MKSHLKINGSRKCSICTISMIWIQKKEGMRQLISDSPRANSPEWILHGKVPPLLSVQRAGASVPSLLRNSVDFSKLGYGTPNDCLCSCGIFYWNMFQHVSNVMG